MRTPGSKSMWRVGSLMSWALFVSQTAQAEDAGVESEAHIQRGVQLRLLGANQEALTEFEAAYALTATPRCRAQIALARQALGDWGRCGERPCGRAERARRRVDRPIP